MAKIAYKEKSLRSAGLETVKKANVIIAEYMAKGFKLTLRQLYYQFVARGLIENTVQSYKRLGDIINEGRLQGLIDWEAIEDRTRSLESLYSWRGPADIVQTCAKTFRIDMWKRQRSRIEVWVEKEALAGVVEGVCQRNRVPYLCCRGYTSQSEMWGAAMRLSDWVGLDQQVVILHLGDHDPSGIDMSRDIQDRFKMFMRGDWRGLEFKRLALNMPQIEAYSPPPNPAKMTDSRFDGYVHQFGEESWELDALSPEVISDLIDQNIAEYRDEMIWEEDRGREEMGRRELGTAAKEWDSVMDFLKQ